MFTVSAKALAKVTEDFPSFYYLSPNVREKCYLIYREPPGEEPQYIGYISGLGDYPKVTWKEGFPPPQRFVVPAPEPDLTNEQEFPSNKVSETIIKLARELKRRGSVIPDIAQLL